VGFKSIPNELKKLFFIVKEKGKGKFHPIIGHKGPEME
jgi:hypothetical protein